MKGFAAVAEPSTFPEEHVAEPLVYRRISGFAIAGLVVAAFFSLYIVVVGAWALFQGSPLLLPPVMWALPVLGAALSLTAILLISRSEGTLAGLKLAKCGWWLSVISGLGYGAFYGATYFAVRQQANDWTLAWFEKLKAVSQDQDSERLFNSALLDTMEPAHRESINPANQAEMERFNIGMVGPEGKEVRGVLERFREQQIVQLIIQGGPETQIQPLGLKEWEYTNDAYKLKRVYRILTAEGTFEAVIPVIGSVSRKREFPGRKWYIEFRELSVQPKEISPLGQKITVLRRQSQGFLQDWAGKLIRGDLASAYLDTLEESQRKQVGAQYASRLLLAGLSAATQSPAATPQALALRCLPFASSELGRELFLPGYYDKFRRAEILVSEKVKGDDEALKTATVLAARATFGSPGQGEARLGRISFASTAPQHPWKLNDNRLSLPQDCMLGFMAGQIPKSICDATITLQTDPGPVDAQRQPAWRVVSVELTRAQDPSRMARPGRATMMAPAPGGQMPQPPPLPR